MSGEGKTPGLFGRARGARVRYHPARAISRLPIRGRRPPRRVEPGWCSEAARTWAAATCQERAVVMRGPWRGGRSCRADTRRHGWKSSCRRAFLCRRIVERGMRVCNGAQIDAPT
eukprot:4795561-Pleurochrysis_carterae.AAC.1